ADNEGVFYGEYSSTENTGVDMDNLGCAD
ncbi:MAG: hypothetical protein EZS28_020482, partial [Streblomastix strix]